MKTARKLLVGLLLGIAITMPIASVHAQTTDPVSVHVFERYDCAHCQAEKGFLTGLEETRNDIKVIFHDVYDVEQKKLFIRMTNQLAVPKVTPLTVIGNQAIQGYSTDEITGAKVVKMIDAAKGLKQMSVDEILKKGTVTVVGRSAEACNLEGDVSSCDASTVDYTVDIPFIGIVDIGKYSLPTIALVLGFVDGFNPCAMWVLVMFLVILLEMGSRKRMFQVAGLFLLAEAVMYYLILNVWMMTWDFIGLNQIVTPIVGFVALASGSYFLYLYYKADTTCKVGSIKMKQKTQSHMRKLAGAELSIATVVGILILAFSVNIIEFACSIGIPQTYTKLLDINYLSFATKQFYNMLYIFMYMIDDLIVFGIAIYSFEKIGLATAKYTRASHLIGGIIMVLLGLMFLIKPSALLFG